MARAYHLISLAPNLAESILSTGEDQGEQYVSELDRRGSAQPLPFSPKALGRLLEQIGHTRRPVAFVLCSKAVTTRRLHFPFTQPKRIAQALRFELESELLGELDQHLYDHKVHVQPDGTALVMAYLVQRATIDELLRVCAQHRIVPQKVTLSAYALFQAGTIGSDLHFQVYAGAEEMFVSVIQHNRLQTIKTFPFNGIERILTASEGEVRTAKQFIQLLDRRGGRAPAEPESPAKAPAKLMERRHQASDSDRALFLHRFRDDLKNDLLLELNRFIRLHAPAHVPTLSLHGVFAPFLAWDPESRQAGIREDLAAIEAPARQTMGILEELQGKAAEISGPSAISFQTRRGGWLQPLVELRKPLAAMGALLLLALLLAGGNLYLKLSTLQRELERNEAELSAALKGAVPAGTTTAAALLVLKQRLEETRQKQATNAWLANYDHDVLNLLLELSEQFKERKGMTAEGLSYNPERFSIYGKTPEYSESEALLNGLKELERFKGRNAKVTHQRGDSDIKYRISVER
jgi:hypothetical protein